MLRAQLRLAMLATALAPFVHGAAGAAPRSGSGPAAPAAAESPAARYANMGRETCLAELARRGAPFVSIPARVPGVDAPIRLYGPLNGISYRTEGSAAQRARSPFETLDCRLALALWDFSSILAAHGVDEVVIFCFWRPPPKSWPAERPADRHPGGLAVDIRRLVRREGEPIVVEQDYRGRIGGSSCGPDALVVAPETGATRELRSIVCEAAAARLFTGILTPNFDAAHHDHLHLDLKPGASWVFLR